MPEKFESHKFTFKRTRLSKILLITAIPAWIIISVCFVLLVGLAGLVGAWILAIAMGVYVVLVVPELVKANGEARLYENHIQIKLYKEIVKIHYKNILVLEFSPNHFSPNHFSPTHGGYQAPYILIVGKSGKRLQIQMDKMANLDKLMTARYEALFHAIRERMNWDYDKRVSKFINIESAIYRAVPYYD